MPTQPGGHGTLLALIERSGPDVAWAASRVGPWQHESLDEGWTPHEHVFHLLANELVFQERIARSLAEEQPRFERWDSHGHMAAFYAREEDIEALAARFLKARAETLALFAALDEPQWCRTFIWPDGNSNDLAWFAEKVLWHSLDHLATLLDIHGDLDRNQAN